MEQNILLCGVGGQGILSIAYVICNAAVKEDLHIKQSEVHGMAQRGGAVQSEIRLSSRAIASDLIPKGTCDLILSVEPLESLRYFDYLRPTATLVTSINPFVNIPNYPDLSLLWKEMENVPSVIPIDSTALAKAAGSALSENMVMLGAASEMISLKPANLESLIKELWRSNESVSDTNLAAFRSGRRMAQFLRAVSKIGATQAQLRALAKSINVEAADCAKASTWADLLRSTPENKWTDILKSAS